MARIIGQFAGMRKPDDFTAYPGRPGTPVVVQGERTIGQFDPATGAGVLCWRGKGSKYFHNLSRAGGGEPFQFPADFVAAAVAERDRLSAPTLAGLEAAALAGIDRGGATLPVRVV